MGAEAYMKTSGRASATRDLTDGKRDTPAALSLAALSV